ncbi:hypothetical protein ABMA27_009546 [Loxostege sticticalis]|uniref:Integrase catalytic domain-containing protein n=1 Tax=Loxostege sticticalis TaxID=481309 RepID=A0ABR3H899_LOXSC
MGNSRSIAVSQYLNLEKRFERNNKLALMYRDFIKEYTELGHMKPSSPIPTYLPECYLPHHGVIREHSTTTKLRVVFNASQKTTSGFSLNQLQEKGPNLQKDIQALILKWRSYKYAYTADIEKMYRCIEITQDQQKLQKIIWRESPTEKLQEYELCTVTYGMKCAPWLAMRTLKQLAMDDGHKYPEAARILQDEFYVDDLVSGHNFIHDALELQQSLIKLLKLGGMNLRKWSANDPVLLQNLSEDQISLHNNFDFKHEESMKTLGLGWNPKTDQFSFNWELKINTKAELTKRTLLSEISKLYDPLGWLSPVTITAKLLWLGGQQSNIELLGFSDASEKAYSCVIYSCVANANGPPTIKLLAAKTRVAPLTQKTTLPRMELCGALLLSQLVEKTKAAFKGHEIKVRAWCDSQVVLAWLQGDASRWERYVANRVNKIKQTIPSQNWQYVKSEHNPADCASRGLYPSKLIKFDLWWNGPEFLQNLETEKCINNLTCLYTTNAELKTKKVATLTTNQEHHFIDILINKCSSLTRVTRVTAWILRFITNARSKTKLDAKYLTTSEITAAREQIIKYVQSTEFNNEYKQLMKHENVTNKSCIFKLNPYLDKKGIIRVGGRLNNSNLPFEMKHPAIIPRSGRFTGLLIEQAHSVTLHGGARLTLAYLRQRYWIVGGNRAVKAKLRHCVRCHRHKQTKTHQIMADLPQQRITPSRPFTHTGVDFTGHVDVKLNKGRGVKTSKGYIAIFVCMATKAVHIELVSDLSTETFIAAFQRMCARRGTPKHVYSDCGTNFIGASKTLHKEFEQFQLQLSSDFFDHIGQLEVEWHPNAPAWPTAGGLWEAAVKSMKFHLRRVLGDQKLTYEEFQTLLTQIEACMNSRPLCPLTEDPDEFQNCLTPGHFLTGSPVMSLPISDYSDDRAINLRRRWQLTENMLQQFWKTWSYEYLTQLQGRSKWNESTKNIKEGDIVLVKDNNLPPGKWAMGRVLETHPGSDGYVRVTTLKTQTGIIKRPIVKLSPLPLETEINPKTPICNEQDERPQKDDLKPEQSTKTKKTKIKTTSALLTTLLTMFICITGSYGEVAPSAYITNLEPDRPIYYDTNLAKVESTMEAMMATSYFNSASLTAYLLIKNMRVMQDMLFDTLVSH